MAAPCCPDRAGQRGWPYSPHWFVLHDDHGRIDIGSTWTRNGLPKSDVELAASLRWMWNEGGHPLVCVTHASKKRDWYMWNGSGRYEMRKTTFLSDLTWAVAEWHREAMRDVWAAVEEYIRRFPDAAQDRLMKQSEKAWARHRAFGEKIWNDAGQHAIGSQLSDAFGQDPSDLDRMTGRIVVDNGVIDYRQVARDGYVRLLPHDPDALVTKRMGTGVRWDPDAPYERFDRFLCESIPDPDQRWWLLWRTCAALFGLMPRKGFVNAIGERDSGKSTYMRLIALLAGDYAKTVPIETFLSKHSGDGGFKQHELMGVRFVYTQEPDQGARFDVSLMKTITGRDAQTTAGKYKDPVTWTPQCTPFIGSNNPIRFATADDAMMEREEAIRFVRGYAVPDPDIDDHLAAELNGVLRMLIEHVTSYVPQLPASIRMERERMAIETDDALSMVEDYIERGLLQQVGPEWAVYHCVPMTKLYDTYRLHWCEEAGVKPVSRKIFRDTVGRKYPPGRSGSSRVFTGLAQTSAWR